MECPLRVREQLPKVEELKYLRVLFTSERRVETEIDRWFLAVGHHECCIALFFEERAELKSKALDFTGQSMFLCSLA